MSTATLPRPAKVKSTYVQLKEKCLPLMVGYETDVTVHDKRIITGNPETPFLHWTRNMGTHISMMLPSDHESWPRPGVREKFLFGTRDRDGFLRAVIENARYFQGRNEPIELVLHFDGKKLREISIDDAVDIASGYIARMRREWHSPR